MRFVLVGAAVLALAGAGRAATILHTFIGGEGGVGDTGFQDAYRLDPTGFTVAGGQLTIFTQPGDIFGRYAEDPGTPTGTDDAKNVFFDNFAPGSIGTQVDTFVTVANEQQDFQGGGIWLGTDEDHYIRLGVIHNGSNLNVEALRENEDLWTVHGGPGNDITGAQATLGAAPGPLSVYLRLVQMGNTAQGFYSLDGTTYNQVGGTFDNVVTGPGQGFGGGATIEGGFKVGAYGFGGGGNLASVSFDYFKATTLDSTAVPEPSTMALLLTGLPGVLAIARRRRAR